MNTDTHRTEKSKDAPYFALTRLFRVHGQRTGQGWVWQNPLPQGNPLYSISFAKDKRHGFAVGSDATILRTTDGGFNWQRQISPVDVVISGVWAPRGWGRAAA